MGTKRERLSRIGRAGCNINRIDVFPNPGPVPVPVTSRCRNVKIELFAKNLTSRYAESLYMRPLSIFIFFAPTGWASIVGFESLNRGFCDSL